MEHASPQTLTYQEFLNFIADRDGRYEYVDGHAVAMGTPSDEHQNVALILGVISASTCADKPAKYGSRPPDVTVTCDPADLAHGTRLKRRPKLIMEILSPNEGDDLKANSTNTKRSRLSRNTSSLFQFDPSYISGFVRFASISYTLNIDALYDEVGIA